MTTRQIDSSKMMFAIIILLFLLTMAVIGWQLMTSSSSHLLTYLNVASNGSVSNLTPGQENYLRAIGALCLASAIFLSGSAVKMELFSERQTWLAWGLFIALLALTGFGGILRYLQNQKGAALLFFACSLIYLILGQIKKISNIFGYTIYNKAKYLPIYIFLSYTMGLPGFAKLFRSDTVLPRYHAMFQESFVATLPGGTSIAIFLIGILEIAVVLLLVWSLMKGELRTDSQKFFLKGALLLAALTFVVLCTGLLIISEHQGAINLVLYAILTLLLLSDVNRIQEVEKK